jgi:hypothetical protein
MGKQKHLFVGLVPIAFLFAFAILVSMVRVRGLGYCIAFFFFFSLSSFLYYMLSNSIWAIAHRTRCVNCSYNMP